MQKITFNDLSQSEWVYNQPENTETFKNNDNIIKITFLHFPAEGDYEVSFVKNGEHMRILWDEFVNTYGEYKYVGAPYWKKLKNTEYWKKQIERN